jgi:hypothetical protein
LASIGTIGSVLVGTPFLVGSAPIGARPAPIAGFTSTGFDCWWWRG